MRPFRAPTLPAERHARWGLGLGVLVAHGLVMALALRGGGEGDARRLPPRASDQPALVYVNTPPLALDAPAPPLRREGRSQPGAPLPAPQKALPAATGPLAPGPAAPALLLALAPAQASAPLAAPAAVAPAQAPSAAPPAPTAVSPAVLAVQAARALPGNPLPAYPEAAREDGLHGQVQLQVALDAQGRVTAVHWLRRSGVLLLDLAARDAVQAWRFEPARRGGEAVAGSLALSIRFQLDAPVSASTLASTAP